MLVKKLLLPAAALLATLGVLSGATACSIPAAADLAVAPLSSKASPFSGHPTLSAGRQVSDDDPSVCTTSWDMSDGSIEVSMYNGTGQTLTLLPDVTGHNGINQHWHKQPPATLAPGQCATMSAYTSDVAEALGVHAVYQMPDSDFVPFTADTHNGSEGSTVFSEEPTYNWSTPGWTGTQDPLYNIWGQTTGGTVHVHVALKLEGGVTDSYQLSSSDMTIAAGATTPTQDAACGLGYHVWMDAATEEPVLSINNSPVAASGLTLATLNPTIADGKVDGTTQYQGFSYALKNPTQAPITAAITWTCDPSVWGTNGTAPTFFQDSPPATVSAGTPVSYRFLTLGFPPPPMG